MAEKSFRATRTGTLGMISDSNFDGPSTCGLQRFRALYRSALRIALCLLRNYGLSSFLSSFWTYCRQPGMWDFGMIDGSHSMVNVPASQKPTQWFLKL
jgi:hypothetical protein